MPVILLAICDNVVSHRVPRTPVAFTEDVTSIAFAWLIFIGAATIPQLVTFCRIS